MTTRDELGAKLAIMGLIGAAAMLEPPSGIRRKGNLKESPQTINKRKSRNKRNVQAKASRKKNRK